MKVLELVNEERRRIRGFCKDMKITRKHFKKMSKKAKRLQREAL